MEKVLVHVSDVSHVKPLSKVYMLQLKLQPFQIRILRCVMNSHFEKLYGTVKTATILDSNNTFSS
jgi:hypothetical protein